ncbi:glycosyltransferase family 39 protein [Flavobacterium orientale]|uniref:Dolichyl-phosphate-mannose-protein mannosyltransferase n=1 Tax=Flavobacterium orientale TaxID=1756020 RepID=A0A916Y0Q4_9FLAO|nr:glycosyltransferase family 39 protein [Flavobacterium orientale]GGD25812.1 hypothetical protein GCM10011343_14870 [Flavobacterium orientale]
MFEKLINHKWFRFVESREIRILILFGLLFRILLSLFYLNISQFPDSSSFMVLANRMLEFNLIDYTGERSPGYPLLIFLAFGFKPLVVLYQFVIGILTTVVWFKTLMNFGFNNRQSLWIAFFLQSFIHVYFYETSILIESLALFLISLIFYQLTTKYLEEKNFKKDLLIGLLLGFLVLVKPFFAYIPFIIYAFSVLKSFSFKNFISSKILILFFPLIAYFGWSYINKVNTGYFVSTTYFGLNLSQNCVHFAEKAPDEFATIRTIYIKNREAALAENSDVAMAIWRAEQELIEATGLTYFPDLSNELGRFAKATVGNAPKEYCYQVVFVSWIDFWKTYICWNPEKFKISEIRIFFEFIWVIQAPILLLFKLLFIGLLPIYIIRFFKTKQLTTEILLYKIIFASSILQAIVTYGTNAKYSYPFEYMMVILVLLELKRNTMLFKTKTN